MSYPLRITESTRRKLEDRFHPLKFEPVELDGQQLWMLPGMPFPVDVVPDSMAAFDTEGAGVLQVGSTNPQHLEPGFEVRQSTCVDCRITLYHSDEPIPGSIRLCLNCAINREEKELSNDDTTSRPGDWDRSDPAPFQDSLTRIALSALRRFRG